MRQSNSKKTTGTVGTLAHFLTLVSDLAVVSVFIVASLHGDSVISAQLRIAGQRKAVPCSRRAGQGRAGQGRAGQGRVGQGTQFRDWRTPTVCLRTGGTLARFPSKPYHYIPCGLCETRIHAIQSALDGAPRLHIVAKSGRCTVFKFKNPQNYRQYHKSRVPAKPTTDSHTVTRRKGHVD